MALPEPLSPNSRTVLCFNASSTQPTHRSNSTGLPAAKVDVFSGGRGGLSKSADEASDLELSDCISTTIPTQVGCPFSVAAPLSSTGTGLPSGRRYWVTKGLQKP